MKRRDFNLLKNILIGIAILAVYFIWLFNSNAYSEARESYLMVTKEKITVSGNFLDTEKFEMDRDAGEIADGYGYKYSFVTKDGRTIESTGWNYGELPTNIEIEYISDSPNINRIKGVLSNEESFTDWLKNKVVFKLFGFSIFVFFSYHCIKSGIDEYKKSKSKSC
ncbi:hypothetical protein [Aureibaculum luteum]|uniref:hypothetical protein n=1 Tax=Aureibaculum luteum TaxID=1548456 RepID=UPI000E54A9B6|nr:hypothetical protein [Aureibaculum luteum]